MTSVIFILFCITNVLQKSFKHHLLLCVVGWLSSVTVALPGHTHSLVRERSDLLVECLSRDRGVRASLRCDHKQDTLILA